VPVLLVGANPGLTLTRDGDRVAFASAWRVDWSAHGSGQALVLWHDGHTRVVTATPKLGLWLADGFTRHFPEVDGLPWPEPEVTEAPVTLDLDLATGLRATGGGVTLELAEPGDPRTSNVDAFPGNGLRLSNVFALCGTGAITVDGRPLEGEPTGFLADAEVWSSM
jgi:hypothetical protein